MRPSSIKRLTKKQLVGYLQDYRDAFPDWDVLHGVMLSRSSGPVTQHVSFEALRSGGYRPLHTLSVVGPPGAGQMLAEHLDVHNRQVRPRDHERMRPRVIQAIKGQFLPTADGPLVPAEVLERCEGRTVAEGITNAQVFTALAALNVHVGHIDKGLAWCEGSDALLENWGGRLADWQVQLASFNPQFREAIQAGTGRELLLEPR